MTKSRCLGLALASVTFGLAAVTGAQGQPRPAEPLIKEGATVKVSDHVYVIPDGSVPRRHNLPPSHDTRTVELEPWENRRT